MSGRKRSDVCFSHQKQWGGRTWQERLSSCWIPAEIAFMAKCTGRGLWKARWKRSLEEQVFRQTQFNTEEYAVLSYVFLTYASTLGRAYHESPKSVKSKQEATNDQEKMESVRGWVIIQSGRQLHDQERCFLALIWKRLFKGDYYKTVLKSARDSNRTWKENRMEMPWVTL